MLGMTHRRRATVGARSRRRYRRRATGAIAVVLTLAAAGAQGATGGGASLTFLDNGRITVGVDLGNGGVVSYLARSAGGGADVLDSAQPSLHVGAWHAASQGGEVLRSSNDGRTIHTETVPLTDDGVPCTCVFETWVTLDGSAVRVRNRLTNAQPDTGPPAASLQELPAVYTTGTAFRLLTYSGSAPYTGGRLTRIVEGAGSFFTPGPSFAATEHWAALVGTGGRGIGLVEPTMTRFAGTPGTSAGVDAGGVNGYLAGAPLEILDPRLVYSFDYALVLGSVREIRAYALAHQPDPRPTYVFRSSRRHWSYVNATDEGTPLDGALRVRLDQDDPQLIGPEQWWRAQTVPTIYVRGAWHTGQRVAQLFWAARGGSFEERRSATFPVVPDGRFRTYAVRLGGDALYRGTVTRLRLDPVAARDPHGFVDVACVSWRPCPVDRPVEATLERPVHETFSNGLSLGWHTSGSGTGARLAVKDGRLELDLAPNAADGPPGGWAGAHVGTNCQLAGDYDVQVDYDLLEWSPTSGASAFMNTYYGPGPDFESVTRNGFPWSETYDGRIQQVETSRLTSDTRGSLRLRRAGATLTIMTRGVGGEWEVVAWGRAVTDPATITLGVATHDAIFGHRSVRVAFDDFMAYRGSLVCLR